MGFALVGLAAGNREGLAAVVIYLAIYLVMTLGAFACVISMRTRDGAVEDIADLSGLARNNPFMALVMGILMFSMAGIPPLAGFFGKFYVFLAAIKAELYVLAVIGVLASVVGAFYYLSIVKVMYFDEPAERFERPPRELGIMMAVAGFLVVFFFVYPSPLISAATTAASSLF
jgi:NADH-quinone oxidoreductase subunit N